MEPPSEDIIHILGQVRQRASENRAFRQTILKDPVKVLQQQGLPVDADSNVVVEYNERYGLFVAIPTSEKHDTHSTGTNTDTTLKDHPADDCLHF